MLFKSLAFAATAAAFLVVPEVSESTEDSVFWALPIEAVDNELPPVTALVQSISVPCAQCRGRDSHLQMEFAVEDGSKLMLNGFELYPNTDPWHDDLIAPVVKASGKSKDRKLGYSLSVASNGMDEDQDLEAINIELRIIEVGRHFISVPTVNINLIKSPSNDLLIANIEMTEVPSQPECSTMWCRIKHSFGSAFGKGKGCGHSKHGSHKDHKGHHEQNHDHHGHKSNDGQQSHLAETPYEFRADGQDVHQWGALWRNVAAYIFLPVLMGVTAGVGVAFVAMLLGSIIARITCALRGRQLANSTSSQKAASADVSEASPSEKEGLVGYTEPPPRYEDA